MWRLEARVIETIEQLGGRAEPMVGPHQFFGLEKNPRAAKIAELEAQYEQECSRILTPSQLSQLQSEQPATTPTGSGNGLG